MEPFASFGFLLSSYFADPVAARYLQLNPRDLVMVLLPAVAVVLLATLAVATKGRASAEVEGWRECAHCFALRPPENPRCPYCAGSPVEG